MGEKTTKLTVSKQKKAEDPQKKNNYCAPLVADLFLFCYERDFMLSLSEDTHSDVIEAFNFTSQYLDDLLNTDNNSFDSIGQPYLPFRTLVK